MLRSMRLAGAGLGLALILVLAFSVGRWSADAQREEAVGGLTVGEVLMWCTPRFSAGTCLEGPGLKAWPGDASKPDRVYFLNETIDAFCDTFDVPEGITVRYFDGSSVQFLPEQGGSRTISACEAIFAPAP